MSSSALLVVLEPFCGGSHAQIVDLLSRKCAARAPVLRYTLSAKKWHWCARFPSNHLIFAPNPAPFTTLLATSMFNLAELLALRPDLYPAHKVAYFHENQFAYPTRPIDRAGEEDRDWQFGHAQVLSALVADVCAFNSEWNLRSFLNGLDRHARRIPDSDMRVLGLAERIRPKCIVLPLPVDASMHMPTPALAARSQPDPAGGAAPLRPLVVAWNHRWEYDKNPALFFATLRNLHDRRVPFRVVLLGQRFTEVPPELEAARGWLEADGLLAHWGFAESREEYLRLLCSADVAVSTADHEFFGVAAVEAAMCGCYLLAPAALSYPELVPPEAHAGHLYGSPAKLKRRLRQLCTHPGSVRRWAAAQAEGLLAMHARHRTAVCGGGGGGGGGSTAAVAAVAPAVAEAAAVHGIERSPTAVERAESACAAAEPATGRDTPHCPIPPVIDVAGGPGMSVGEAMERFTWLRLREQYQQVLRVPFS